MALDGAALGARLRERDLGAAPAVLNLVENAAPTARRAVADLLREVSPGALGGEAPGHVVGVTGPPGAGKSTLLSELARAWRAGRGAEAGPAVAPPLRRAGGAPLRGPARPATRPRGPGGAVPPSPAA